MTDISKDELKEFISDNFENSIGMNSVVAVKKLINHFNLNEPGLPEGFKALSHTDFLLMPHDVTVRIQWNKNHTEIGSVADYLLITEGVVHCQVVSVPTLKPGDGVPEDVWFYSINSETISWHTNSITIKTALIESGRGYATQRHAQLALDWGLLKGVSDE